MTVLTAAVGEDLCALWLVSASVFLMFPDYRPKSHASGTQTLNTPNYDPHKPVFVSTTLVIIQAFIACPEALGVAFHTGALS